MTRLLCVLATTLVLVAAAGCSDDDGGEAGGTADTRAPVTAPAGTTAAPATTEEPATTAEPATTEDYDARPAPPADQSRWARQVDVVCKPWQERIDELAAPADAAGLESWLAELLPLVRRQLAAVRALKPPAKRSEAEPAKRFLANMTQLERSLTRYRAALEAGDGEAVQRALVEANAAGAAARNDALVLDVTQCGGYSDS